MSRTTPMSWPREIDDEVRRIIEDGHELALRVLREHIDELHRISQILIERETIDKDQFARLVTGEPEDDVFPPVEEPPPCRLRERSRDVAPRSGRGRSRSRARRSAA